jgi:hypothetical protein
MLPLLLEAKQRLASATRGRVSKRQEAASMGQRSRTDLVAGAVISGGDLHQMWGAPQSGPVHSTSQIQI